MISLNLQKLAEIVHGQYEGPAINVQQIAIDSRQVSTGDLFVAIKGETFDGHDFLNEVYQKGAAAAVVTRPINCAIPQIIVEDTRKALGELAKYQRQIMPKPLLAITGSCGKTTTRSLLASIIGQMGDVLQSQSSFNNDIGLPFTLLQQTDAHDYIVQEMGTNHFGELAYLTDIARPNVATIINIGSAHLEYFKDLDGVSRAKAEIFQGLADDGVAVINADDAYAEKFKSIVAKHKIITFGIEKSADVTANTISIDNNGYPAFNLHYQGKEALIKLQIVGKHNILNALAAAACGFAAGATIAQVEAGLNQASAVAKRLIWRQTWNGAKLLDDSYNAIPNAVHASLDVLGAVSGHRIFIFGGMAEIGETTIAEHEKVGLKAKQNQVEAIYAIGPMSQHTIKAFGDKGQWFANKSDLIDQLKKTITPEMTLLVKGSRGARMEEVVAALVQQEGSH